MPSKNPISACRLVFALGRGSARLSVALALTVGAAAAPATLPPWTPGTFDIHQIAAGRGSAALLIAPDGTSVMIDAGTTNNGPEVATPVRPDDSRRAGEWIGRYALRHLRATGRAQLDYFVASHLHPDHIGDPAPGAPVSLRGDYLLAGLTDVAELVPITTLIDRGFPDYRDPVPLRAAFAYNYLAYVRSRTAAGAVTEQAQAGSVGQIRLRHAAARFPTFAVRILAAGGAVWTGEGDAARRLVPPADAPDPADRVDENTASVALRVSYGAFDYYTGGDLACDTRDDTQPWRDLETPVARAAGAVEVAVANHHAYFDAVGPASVRALRPLVWVIPAWHLTHPGMAQLERMLSERLYPGSRDIFTTDLMPATRLLNDRFLPKVKSTSGHIVVRVAPGGAEFRVFVTDNRDENDTVIAIFGPYRCR